MAVDGSLGKLLPLYPDFYALLVFYMLSRSNFPEFSKQRNTDILHSLSPVGHSRDCGFFTSAHSLDEALPISWLAISQFHRFSWNIHKVSRQSHIASRSWKNCEAFAMYSRLRPSSIPRCTAPGSDSVPSLLPLWVKSTKKTKQKKTKRRHHKADVYPVLLSSCFRCILKSQTANQIRMRRTCIGSP